MTLSSAAPSSTFSLNGTFHVVLHIKADLVGTALESLDYPMLETKDEWLVTASLSQIISMNSEQGAFGNLLDPSVYLALRACVPHERRFLMTTKS